MYLKSFVNFCAYCFLVIRKIKMNLEMLFFNLVFKTIIDQATLHSKLMIECSKMNRIILTKYICDVSDTHFIIKLIVQICVILFLYKIYMFTIVFKL